MASGYNNGTFVTSTSAGPKHSTIAPSPNLPGCTKRAAAKLKMMIQPIKIKMIKIKMMIQPIKIKMIKIQLMRIHPASQPILMTHFPHSKQLPAVTANAAESHHDPDCPGARATYPRSSHFLRPLRLRAPTLESQNT